MTQEKLKPCPGSAPGAKKHLPLQLANNLFEDIIINNNTTQGYSPIRKVWNVPRRSFQK